MNRRKWLAAVLLISFALIGCVGGGDGGGGPPLFVTDLLSDPAVDGDIDDGGTIANATRTGTVLAGVDPASGTEYRGFLNFPLTSVPASADVQMASLEVFVNDLNPTPLRSTPFTLDLVSFAPPLRPSDFSDASLPPILSRNFDAFASDPGNFVAIDATALVREAFFRGLPDAQFRILLEANESVGLLTIADPVASVTTAPTLHIEYF